MPRKGNTTKESKNKRRRSGKRQSKPDNQARADDTTSSSGGGRWRRLRNRRPSDSAILCPRGRGLRGRQAVHPRQSGSEAAPPSTGSNNLRITSSKKPPEPTACAQPLIH
jgi:hypothetical protein